MPKSRAFVVRLPVAVADHLAKVAALEGVPMGEVVRHAIAAYLRTPPRPRAKIAEEREAGVR